MPVTEKRRGYNTAYAVKRTARIKHQIIRALGGKCSSPTCGWINEDGSRGCKDYRCLQIDHIQGDGHKDPKRSGIGYYSRVLAFLKTTLDQTTYQLLCANCNWIKRVVNREFFA